MRSKTWALVALTCLLLLPAAAAQEPKPDGADDDAPTFGDCGAEVCAYGPDDCIECSGPVDGDVSDGPSAPQDCGGEVCAYDGGPGELGPDGCIDCMVPPADDDAHAPSADATPRALAPAANGLAVLLGVALVVLSLRFR